jgi:hypothetical protein
MQPSMVSDNDAKLMLKKTMTSTTSKALSWLMLLRIVLTVAIEEVEITRRSTPPLQFP